MNAATFITLHKLNKARVAGMLGLNAQTVSNYVEQTINEPVTIRMILDVVHDIIQAAKEAMPKAEKEYWEKLRKKLHADSPACLIRQAVLACYGSDPDHKDLMDDIANDYLTCDGGTAGEAERLDYCDGHRWTLCLVPTGKSYNLTKEVNSRLDREIIIERTLR